MEFHGVGSWKRYIPHNNLTVNGELKADGTPKLPNSAENISISFQITKHCFFFLPPMLPLSRPEKMEALAGNDWHMVMSHTWRSKRPQHMSKLMKFLDKQFWVDDDFDTYPYPSALNMLKAVRFSGRFFS